ncbi:MAG: hypothetical protein GXP58_04220 [Deltaproteobacteria bacterium]|nr:hypothetical protein [Deltaproteobacteria bacterium]
MLTGYNTDFVYKDNNFHVQTEDNGIKNPVIVTLLYKEGKILCSRKLSYADILKADCLENVIRNLMKEQHKQMIMDLRDGRFEEKTKDPQAAEPSEEASLDEIILDYLSDGDDP